jgi:hypothetical protein
MRSVMPKLPAHAVKTYAVLQPLDSHFRVADCTEVGCLQNANGWDSVLDVSTVKGARAAEYIRSEAGRAYTVVETGTIVRFRFPPGQRCFHEHHLPLERPALFVVRDGDWRGNPRGTPARRLSDADWVDDFANHQQRIADRLEQG